MRRVTSEEWLDEDQGSPEEIRQSFEDLWRINRHLGGVSGCLELFERYLARTGARSIRVLEVGSGDARMAAKLREELERRGVQSEFVALDRSLVHLQQGEQSRPGILPIVADALALPFAPRSFDVVSCNLFFHHFSGDRAIDLLKRLAEVASGAVLVNDLERRALAYLFIRVAYPFARSRVTRHDGPASVRQAYTLDELRLIALKTGYDSEVKRLPAYRLGLILWTI